MRIPRAHTAFTLLAFAATATIIAACSDDENGIMEPPPPGLVGTWNATSIMAGGEDFFAQGMRVSFNFGADNEYSFVVTGDLLEFCDSQSSCSDFGDYTATTSTITFDPGTTDELTLTYTISGDTLTASGTFDTEVLTMTFERT